MPDISIITQLIGSLGFPIVCCGFLFWDRVQSSKKHAEERQNIISIMSTALDSNTKAINALTYELQKRKY